MTCPITLASLVPAHALCLVLCPMLFLAFRRAVTDARRQKLSKHKLHYRHHLPVPGPLAPHPQFESLVDALIVTTSIVSIHATSQTIDVCPHPAQLEEAVLVCCHVRRQVGLN
ncbi:hypothetical protein M427DRAFT_175363 [Gonapodya prolifera JEL478]|uniref:Uncharacterized protein n=1 Tax=Gonapodya prolifera (strain JEL478) TaxID=1344416 RepID=A0A139B0P1_GONPJ|nr:hypothetical protein M427DRAFT_175363 [Gonapodya prolifera JEL478]|eukprot:KXS22566.1 hypothetical protein M427DRAFT_175363 [Gonapodya prolifera JEL478]